MIFKKTWPPGVQGVVVWGVCCLFLYISVMKQNKKKSSCSTACSTTNSHAILLLQALGPHPHPFPLAYNTLQTSMPLSVPSTTTSLSKACTTQFLNLQHVTRNHSFSTNYKHRQSYEEKTIVFCLLRRIYCITLNC